MTDSVESTETQTVEGLETFLDTLPEDIRGEASLKDFKDTAGLAKSYVHAQKMIGSSLRVPSEDASDEAKTDFYNKLQGIEGVVRIPPKDAPEDSVNDFYKKLGRPESQDKYKLNLPEGVELNKDNLAQFLDLSYNIGLSNDQADALAQYEVTRMKAQSEDFEKDKVHATEVLKKQWGQDYDARLQGAKLAAEKYAEKYPEDIKQIVDGPLGNNPAVLAMLSELGRTLKETGHVGKQSGQQYGDTPEEALGQISDIKGNKAHPWHDASHPQHGAAMERMRKLYSAAFSDKG